MPAPQAHALFRKHYGFPPAHVVRVPAPIELLGCASLVQDGLAISTALDRFVEVACSPRVDGKIQLYSSVFARSETFWVTGIKRIPATPWADFPKSVLVELRRRGVHFGGFDALVLDDIPSGLGLDRFPAQQVAMGLAVRCLHPFSLSATGLSSPPQRDQRGFLPGPTSDERKNLAALCTEAATRFLNVPSSLLGPLSCLCSKDWHVMAVDLRFNTIDHLPLLGQAIVFCAPKGLHGSVTPNTSGLKAKCASAARKLGLKSLRLLEPPVLRKRQNLLSDAERDCATHVCGEIARVVAAERVLREEDYRQFGVYVTQSGESACSLYGQRTPDFEDLLEAVLAHGGCAGARVHGNATLSLVQHHQVEVFLEQIASSCRGRGRGALQSCVCRPVDGPA